MHSFLFILIMSALCAGASHLRESDTVQLPASAAYLPISAAEAAESADSAAGDVAMKKRLVVDVERSVIHWKGTKFFGIRSHAGEVRLVDGFIIIHQDAILAGRFTLDMTTIEVTDIPESDPVPRRRLREHLLNEDFFFVERYPSATFEITQARQEEPGRYRISGQLTMRGRTHGVILTAHVPVLSDSALRATARFSINRHDWGVAYRGSRLTNDLVDDMIDLNLILVADEPADKPAAAEVSAMP